MEQNLRQIFNGNFSEESFQQLLKHVEEMAPGSLDFRLAETPVFIPKIFTDKMLQAVDDIIDCVCSSDFKKLTEKSIPNYLNIDHEPSFPEMMVFDFGVCKNEDGDIEPQLIEMQGFPSLYAYQLMLDELMRDYASVPKNYDSYLNNYNKEKYIALLKDLIIENEHPENVILLEVLPEEQKTRIDFKCTEKILGIKTVCITQLFNEGNQLFYLNGDRKINIKRIFNRIVFDDLQKIESIQTIDLKKSYEVTWIPHPYWFYRISKFTLPFLQNPNIPTTYFLNELTSPLPLNEYVLKPLFSYAGTGVIIDLKQEDIEKINNPENWILQKKVNYADIIETPDGFSKVEIRLFYFWNKNWERPVASHNLARLSKGEMIGTRYNKNKKWVGGTIAYFEK